MFHRENICRQKSNATAIPTTTNANDARHMALATAATAALLALGAAMALVPGHARAGEEAQSSFINTNGEEIGTLTVNGVPDAAILKIELRDLPPGQWVAFHIHENGECDAKGGFKSAGGHFNPTNKSHGHEFADGPHAGDMMNQYVNDKGELYAQILNNAVRFDGTGETDIHGKAVIIHAGADDYKSQPSGDAGDRIACAVIE
ncbi:MULTISPECIES: superoxide dismutase family protein [Thalassospira]|jgi:Cu-Zn family superoxide dismutase|nr:MULTISPECIES: superoxide dismutase family protein [Thalassospira]OCK07854.1 superoxide dismutase copper/zinc binding protein [Thalassospira sp. KO164]PXX32808.1 Cu-Zn family superoxide dismutase [Thalassospira sp. 11-3]SEE26173.1 superoxide dismutase, Cu-Zn family [Thalassospira permensis]|tara:strand:+ start:46375 stop:46986 length:612 start_codon:yes stop_codon:yes gene_type:complete